MSTDSCVFWVDMANIFLRVAIRTCTQHLTPTRNYFRHALSLVAYHIFQGGLVQAFILCGIRHISRSPFDSWTKTTFLKFERIFELFLKDRVLATLRSKASKSWIVHLWDWPVRANYIQAHVVNGIIRPHQRVPPVRPHRIFSAHAGNARKTSLDKYVQVNQ